MKKELYYWGGTEGYSWNQLLYIIRNYIVGTNYSVGYQPEYNFKLLVDNFLKGYSHNNNDGIWKKERRQGEYLGVIYFSDLETRKVKYRYWYAPSYIVAVFYPHMNRVVDSYGRIIPSCILKKDLLSYIPRAEDNPKKYKPWRKWHFGSKWRIQHTSKFKGNHGYLGNECRQNSIFIEELKDFNFKIKYNKSRLSEVKSSYTDWDSRDIYGGIKRSWKRSKKRKQWM